MAIIRRILSCLCALVVMMGNDISDIHCKSPIPLLNSPQTYAEYHRIWDYVAANALEEVTVHYPAPYTNELKSKIDGFIQETTRRYRYFYPEYQNYYYATEYKFDECVTGLNVIITFEPIDPTVTYEMKSQAIEAARKIHEQLYEDGTLCDGMSERERAWEIVKWVCNNTNYKKEDNALCHTAYSVFFNKTGVCDGMSAATQLLLRLDGIKCHGSMGKTGGKLHHWTIAVLDGKTVGIDATWCNKEDGPSDQYFAVDLKTFLETHKPEYPAPA